jgi:hypothetical protein
MTRTLFVLAALASLGLLSGCPDDPNVPLDGSAEDTGMTSDTGGPIEDGSIPDEVPIFRNPVATPDAELAMQSLRLMGSTDAGATAVLCNDCHDLTRQTIRNWVALSDSALTNCLPDLTLAGGDAAAAAVVACANDEGGLYAARNLGIFSTGGDLPWFRYVFANGAAAGEHERFLAEGAMPRDYEALTQEQFDILAEWFIRGAPGLEDIVPADPLPTTCTPGVSQAMIDYIEARATDSWTTVNAANGMLMYGCAGASNALGCLASETASSATTFGAEWDDLGPSGVPGTTSRVLYNLDYRSSYWTRGSADGRFVSHGATSGPGIRFVDLAGGGAGPETARVIGADASYDPFFFPDDSGFVVQGDGTSICEMSLLTTGTPTSVNLGECLSSPIGLYQHLGAALGGGDFWSIDSTSDVQYSTYDPGSVPTRTNPGVSRFSSSNAHSTVRFFANTGSGFSSLGRTDIAHPYEGDAVISPSLGLMLTRQAGEGGQLGYVLRTVTTTGTGGSRDVEGVEVGRYCINGAKAGFSYDERFFVIHRYVEAEDAVEMGFTGPSDPAFAPYLSLGAANIYMVDMATGAEHRVTNMQPGQYALFPYFRSDNWMYYLVRTGGGTPERLVANDAALRVAPL